MNVVVVCTGCINRGPAAATILKSKRPGWEVRARALKGKPGLKPTKAMRTALRSLGYETLDIRSERITDADAEWGDVFIGMQPSHTKALETLVAASENGKGKKVYNLAGWLQPPRAKIDDPQFSHNHAIVAADINAAIQNFVVDKT